MGCVNLWWINNKIEIDMINWKFVKNFESYEFDDPRVPGSGSQVNGELLFKLQSLRDLVDLPIITHWKVGGCVDINGTHGHAKNSYHLKSMGCKACDFHFDDSKDFIDPRKLYRFVEEIGFGGIGVYYDWHWDGKLLPIGFHVDVRPVTKTQRWVRRDNNYLYLLGR